jgi:hypothetical protein
MITLFNTKSDKEKSISDLKNPFDKSCIEQIHIMIYKGRFEPREVRHFAKIEFINGNTKGEQEIRAENLPSLLSEIQNFIDNL